MFHKNSDVKKNQQIQGLLRINSLGEDLLDCSSLPPLMDPPFKPTNLSPPPKPSDGYYIPNPYNNNNQLHQPQQLMMKPHPMMTSPNNNNYTITTNHPNPNFITHHQIHHQTQNPNAFSFQHINNNNNNQGGDYMGAFANNNQNDVGLYGLERMCKTEPLVLSSSGNQSMVSASQDTGGSNDRNTDTSSAVSKLHMGKNKGALYEDLEPPSAGPLSDLECLWDY